MRRSADLLGQELQCLGRLGWIRGGSVGRFGHAQGARGPEEGAQMRDLRKGTWRALGGLGALALVAGFATADPGTDPAPPEPAVVPQDVQKDDTKPAALPTTMKLGTTTWTLYGFVDVSAAYNDSRMNSIRLPGVVLAESPGGGAIGHSKGEFAMWARNSRLGISMVADAIGVLGDSIPSAALEFDFLGGGVGTAAFPLSESVTPLRIRKAYVRLKKSLEENGWFAVQLGQDWEIIAPQNPGVNEETYMWGVGNVGGFRPHLRGELLYKLSDDFGILSQIGLGVTGVQDLADFDANGTIDGEASELPNLQLRGAVELNALGANEPLRAGAWVHKQYQETDVFIAGRKRFHGWGWGVDFSMSLMPMGGDIKRDQVYVKGEFYWGANLSDIRGGTAGGLFPGRTPGPGAGKNITEVGWWVEGGYAINESLIVLGGLGAADPESAGLPAGTVSVNRAYWGGLKYDVSPVLIGFELMYWETRYLAPGTPRHSVGNTIRYHLFFRYAF